MKKLIALLLMLLSCAALAEGTPILEFCGVEMDALPVAVTCQADQEDEVVVDDPETVQKVMDAFTALEIGEASDLYACDAGFTLRMTFEDGSEQVFRFEMDNLFLLDGINYTVPDGTKELRQNFTVIDY